jgi:hypothetical protein
LPPCGTGSVTNGATVFSGPARCAGIAGR